ncbi:hypothetical protein Syun_020496 [Stephania yunnanensis]|uniref:Uncharacterized protein n=1 Tax=Stephania yunnanensis TaxID=152371 RepID=A0AAP0IDW3_9MAGN
MLCNDVEQVVILRIFSYIIMQRKCSYYDVNLSLYTKLRHSIKYLPSLLQYSK